MPKKTLGFEDNPALPTSNVWTNLDREATESQLDAESSVSLRCFLSPDFVDSKNWSELIDRLRKKGFRLVFQNERLTLVNAQTDVTLCTCQFLGHSFGTLAAVFGKPCVLANTGELVHCNTQN